MTISRFRAKKISAILDVAMNFFKVSRCLSGCLSQVHEFIQNTLMEWKKKNCLVKFLKGITTQPAITCSKLTIETLEQGEI